MAESNAVEANKACTQKFADEAVAAVTDYINEAFSVNSDAILHIHDLNMAALRKYTSIAQSTGNLSQKLAPVNDQYVDLANDLHLIDSILEKIPLLERKVANLDEFVGLLEEEVSRRSNV